ncbi:MAG: hypothetical protein WDN31_08190 [Hyphomicrobium sp.]
MRSGQLLDLRRLSERGCRGLGLLAALRVGLDQPCAGPVLEHRHRIERRIVLLQRGLAGLRHTEVARAHR